MSINHRKNIIYYRDLLPGLTTQLSFATASKTVLISVLISVLHLAFFFLFRADAGLLFFGGSVLLMGLHGVSSFRALQTNYALLFRYLLIWVPVFITALVWFVWRGEVFTASFCPHHQTNFTTSILVTGGALSSYGAMAGWCLSGLYGRVRWRSLRKESSGQKVLFNSTKFPAILACSLVAAFLSAILVIWLKGGLISASDQYAQGNRPDVKFGVMGVVLLFFISIALVYVGRAKFRRILFLLVLFCLSLPLLAGSRADTMFPVLLVVLYYIRGFKKRIRWYVWGAGIVVALTLFILSSAIGEWRGIGENFGTILTNEVTGFTDNCISEDRGFPLIYMSTANQVMGTFYGFIGKINTTHEIGYLWGESYFNYLLIAPPGFLGFSRPLGLEWSTDIGGERMSQGGVFEVAEAYANFGLLGCFLISFVVSFCIQRLLCLAVKKKSSYFLLWYLVSVFMFARSIWYQNFSFFRIATVFVAIYYPLHFLWRRLDSEWWCNPKLRKNESTQRFRFSIGAK